MLNRIAAAWTRMHPLVKTMVVGALLGGFVAVLAPGRASADGGLAVRYTSPAIGAWVGQVHGAQYEDHLYAFHSDGTMIGTNPQRVQERADGTGVNDSLAVGAWRLEHGRVVGKFLELNANQSTHAPAATLTVIFNLEAHGDHLTGAAHVFVGTEQVPDATFELSRIRI